MISFPSEPRMRSKSSRELKLRSIGNRRATISAIQMGEALAAIQIGEALATIQIGERTLATILSEIGEGALPVIPSEIEEDDFMIPIITPLYLYLSSSSSLLEFIAKVINLDTQLKEFEKVQSLLKKELGVEKARKLFENAVYFFSIGSNDYMGGYLGISHMREAHPPDEFVEMVVNNLTRSIQELYEKGARKFGFLSLCPLGCLPVYRPANPKGDRGCLEELSALELAHNNALSAVLVSLNYILQGFRYANADIYGWVSDRIHHPSNYGNFCVAAAVCPDVLLLVITCGLLL